MSVVPYTVKSGDTIQRIALLMYRDADRSAALIEYNRLDYPFITDNPNFQTNVRAAGRVRFERSSTSGAVSIPEGTRVALPATGTTPEREYVTTSAVVLAVGATTVEADAICIVPGPFGNMQAGAALVMKESAFTGISVRSLSDFTGGRILQVKRPGDVLLIPTAGQVTVVAEEDRELDAYRADLSLAVDGDLEIDLGGDLRLVSGAANLDQALAERLSTPVGFYTTSPLYGSVVPSLVGRRNTPFWTEIVELEVESTLLSDPRVKSVDGITVHSDGDRVNVTAKVTGIASDQSQLLTVAL